MSELVVWTCRMTELGPWRAPGFTWEEIWDLLAYAQRNHDLDWAQAVLWRLKLWTWVRSLDADPATCRCCGARIESGHKLARYCSTACRKVAYRRNKADEPTPFAALQREAQREIRAVQREIRTAERWMRRMQKLHKVFVSVPPDLSQIDHLPLLPRRCQGACDQIAGCENTRGSVCLFANTGSVVSEPRDEP